MLENLHILNTRYWKVLSTFLVLSIGILSANNISHSFSLNGQTSSIFTKNHKDQNQLSTSHSDLLNFQIFEVLENLEESESSGHSFLGFLNTIEIDEKTFHSSCETIISEIPKKRYILYKHLKLDC